MKINPEHTPELARLQQARRPDRVGAGYRRQPEARQPEPTDVRLSEEARQFQRGRQLLDEAEQPRPEAIARGRAILANWQAPDDAAVDRIMGQVQDEL